jgi:hypothetical protein
MNKLSRVVIFSLFLLAAAGCDEDDRVAKTATEAAERQAEQNRQMAQLQGQVAEGSKRLVEADAKARAELTALQHDLQESQADPGRQRDQLEAERRGLAEQRGRDPIIAVAITTLGMVLACMANAFAAYVRLVELGKASLAYPTVLARYAVMQFHAGRRVGTNSNVRDVLSEYCRQQKKITVERLDQFDRDEGAWKEVLVEDRHAGPANTARVRIDFSDWLRSLPAKVRRIAKTLAVGERTDATARKFGVSPGRISRLRGELAVSWRRFVGDELPKEAALAAA